MIKFTRQKTKVGILNKSTLKHRSGISLREQFDHYAFIGLDRMIFNGEAGNIWIGFFLLFFFADKQVFMTSNPHAKPASCHLFWWGNKVIITWPTKRGIVTKRRNVFNIRLDFQCEQAESRDIYLFNFVVYRFIFHFYVEITSCIAMKNIV